MWAYIGVSRETSVSRTMEAPPWARMFHVKQSRVVSPESGSYRGA